MVVQDYLTKKKNKPGGQGQLLICMDQSAGGFSITVLLKVLSRSIAYSVATFRQNFQMNITNIEFKITVKVDCWNDEKVN